ncbi:hypothetical protein ABZ791_03750 [Streptomyces huasconensis]|uniref:Uncharacterized protein n=1 Tax=Streptomyces huasconensis TaxID=1854574 RepID=A0ABV3LY11_9ACTN
MDLGVVLGMDLSGLFGMDLGGFFGMDLGVFSAWWSASPCRPTGREGMPAP